MKRAEHAQVDLRPASLRAFGAAMRRRRETLEMTLDVVAAKTGISKPYLSNIETARAPGPPSEGKLVQLAAALGWETRDLLAAGDWLRTPESVRRTLRRMAESPGMGEGMGGGDSPRRADGAIDLDRVMGRKEPAAGTDPRIGGSGGDEGAGEGRVPLVEVPVINRVAAGRPAEYTDLDYPAGIAEAYVPAPDLPEAPVKSAFGLRVTGDSMEPEYVEGDIVIVGPGDPTAGDDCVVRLGREDNFATTFKRVFFVRGGKDEQVRLVRLVALNPKYTERVVAAEEVTGIYPLLYRLMPAKRPSPAAANAVPPPQADDRFSSRVAIEND